MNSPIGRKARGFRFDASISLGLHILVWAIILAAFAPRLIPLVSAMIEAHHKAVALAHDPRKAKIAGGDSRHSMTPSRESAAAAQVEAQIAQAVAGELSQKDEQKLLEKVHENLLQDAEKLQQTNAANNDTDMEKLAAELKQDALGDVAQDLKEMAAQELQAEIDAQLNGGIYDQLKNAIEQGAGSQMSAAIAAQLKARMDQERQERMNKAVAGLEQVKKQYTDTKNADVQPAAAMTSQNQLGPAADAAKKAATDSGAADKAASDALADAVKDFPQVSAQADQAGKALAGDTQQALQAASTDLAAKNQAAAAGDLTKANDSLDKRIAALNQVEDQVRQAGSSNNVDPMSQQMLAQSMGDLQKSVGDQMQKQSIDAMKAPITDRLTQALTAQATTLNVSPDQLRAMVQSEIKTQLPASFQDHPPDTSVAMDQTRADNQLLTAAEAEKARQAADAAVQKLETARQSEAAVPFADAAKPADDLNKQQEQATSHYQDAHQQVEQARDLARGVSAGDQNRSFAIGDADRHAEADTKLKVLPDLVNSDQRPVADQLKTQLVQSLDERIAQMKDLENNLTQEKAALDTQAQAQAQSKAGTGPVKPDPSVAAALGKEMKKDVEKIAADQLPGMLATAGAQVQASDSQSTDLRMNGISSLLGKVGQLQSNMAEGRPGMGLEGEGLGLGNGMGAGPGPGNGMPAGKGAKLYRSRFSAFNASAIENYGKYLRNRSDPANFYTDAKETDGDTTVAHAVDPSELPAMVYFEAGDPADTAASPAPAGAAERKVPDPTFKTVAFGAAPMMDHPITVDGDLSDWGPLTLPMATKFHSDGSPVADPTQVYVRWTPEGIYIGYTTKKVGPIVHDAHLGDCIEVWIDGQNVRRKQMSDSPTSQQIFIAPFGYQGNPAPAIVEVGRGTRGLGMYGHYVDRDGTLGRVAAKMVPGGYTVEAFLSRKGIAYPNLVPGAYLAFNFSVNHGADPNDEEQWSAAKSLVTWDKPDTWGDLLLLGTDAKVKFISFDDPAKPVQPLIPGQPLAFEIQDKDMDLNPHKRDRVPAVLRIKGDEDGLYVVLEETAVDSGIFRGSVNTQPYGAPPKENTLNIRGGQSVELIYNDLRTEFGEANHEVTADLPVGTPVLRLAGRQ